MLAATHPWMIRSNRCFRVFECFQCLAANRTTCSCDPASSFARHPIILFFNFYRDRREPRKAPRQCLIHIRPNPNVASVQKCMFGSEDTRALRRARRPFDPLGTRDISRAIRTHVAMCKGRTANAAQSSTPSELRQEPRIALEQEANVRNSISEHRQSFEPEAKRKPCVSLRI